jgi:hypothetical protein
MEKSHLRGCVVVALLLALVWVGMSGNTSEAAPLLNITPTPTNTPSPTPTNTPEPPTDTPRPPDTPTPLDTPTPTPTSAVGILTLPRTGQANLAPLWLLVIVAGLALLILPERARS